MANEYPNSGIMFDNRGNKKSEKSPDMTGKCEVDCPQCRAQIHLEMASWWRSGQRGDFLTVKFSPPRETRSSGRPQGGPPSQQSQRPPQTNMFPTGDDNPW